MDARGSGPCRRCARRARTPWRVSTISPMMRNRAAFSLASCAYAAVSRSRTPKRFFCAEITSRIADLGVPCRVHHVEQHAGRKVAAAGERPRDARDHARACLPRARARTSGRSSGSRAPSAPRRRRRSRSCPDSGKCAEHGFDRRRAQILELGDGFLCVAGSAGLVVDRISVTRRSARKLEKKLIQPVPRVFAGHANTPAPTPCGGLLATACMWQDLIDRSSRL